MQQTEPSERQIYLEVITPSLSLCCSAPVSSASAHQVLAEVLPHSVSSSKEENYNKQKLKIKKKTFPSVSQVMPFILFAQHIIDDDILIAPHAGPHKVINTYHVVHGCFLCHFQGELCEIS